MASAAAGSCAVAVRTSASRAAVEGVAGTPGGGTGRRREGLEELRVGLRRAELVGEVRLHELPRPALGQGVTMAVRVTGSARSMRRYCSA